MLQSLNPNAKLDYFSPEDPWCMAILWSKTD